MEPTIYQFNILEVKEKDSLLYSIYGKIWPIGIAMLASNVLAGIDTGFFASSALAESSSGSG